MKFLTTEPLWLVAILLVVVPTGLSVAGQVFVRRRIGLAKLSTNNEVAGFKFAVVGVLYAVLLAFAVIIVWEKFSDAENDVEQEAGAAATIYRLADGIGTQPGHAMRGAIGAYLTAAIEQDWPAMERGGASRTARLALDGVYATLLTYSPDDRRGVALTTEILHQLDSITQARRARLVMASGNVPGVIYVVLFGGAFLTVAFTFFFGTENLRAQTLMTGALTVLIFAGLLIIVLIDRPFAGSVKVGPEPLQIVLDDFGTP